MYTYVYICMYVCMLACMHACMYVDIYIYMYMYKCIYIYVYIYVYIYGVAINGGSPKWMVFLMESRIKLDDLEVSPFQETSMCIYI